MHSVAPQIDTITGIVSYLVLLCFRVLPCSHHALELQEKGCEICFIATFAAI